MTIKQFLKKMSVPVPYHGKLNCYTINENKALP